MRSMQWQLGILGTISPFAFRHRETKNGVSDYQHQIRSIRKSKRSNMRYGQPSYNVFWKNGNRSAILSRKSLTRFSLTNVMLYCNSHFETDSNCTATLFYKNFALNDEFPPILMIKVILILNSFSDFNTFLNKTQHSFYKHITVYHFPSTLQTVAQIT